MNKKIQINILFLSIFVGLVLNFVFVYFTGKMYATALFPVMEILAAFVISGFIIGYYSKGITIIEPGIGALFVSVISFFFMPMLGIESLKDIWFSDWLLIYLNGIILTFIGAWLGELFEHGSINRDLEVISFNWEWIIAGTVTGIVFSIFTVNFLRFLFGPNPSLFIIPYFVSLLISGLIVGWKSPGVTVREAGISGFLVITTIFDIIRLTLLTQSEIGWHYILIGGILGVLVSMLGAYIGEKIQAKQEATAEAR